MPKPRQQTYRLYVLEPTSPPNEPKGYVQVGGSFQSLAQAIERWNYSFTDRSGETHFPLHAPDIFGLVIRWDEVNQAVVWRSEETAMVRWYVWREQDEGGAERIGGPFTLARAEEFLKTVQPVGRAPICFIAGENGERPKDADKNGR